EISGDAVALRRPRSATDTRDGAGLRPCRRHTRKAGRRQPGPRKRRACKLSEESRTLPDHCAPRSSLASRKMALVEAHCAWVLRAVAELTQAIRQDLGAVHELESILASSPGDLRTNRALAKLWGDLATMYNEDLRAADALDAARRSQQYTE